LSAYLAAEQGLHPRDQLAALLWPDRGEAEARNSLRSALVYLRQALDDADAALAVTRGDGRPVPLPLPRPRHTGAGAGPAPGPPARERALFYWLAVEREPVGLAGLVADLGPGVARGEALEALEALGRRSLLERGNTG
jgi:hypothetical protein